MRLQEVLEVTFLPASFTGPKILPRSHQASFVVVQRRSRDSGQLLQAFGTSKKTRQARRIGHEGAPLQGGRDQTGRILTMNRRPTAVLSRVFAGHGAT